VKKSSHSLHHSLRVSKRTGDVVQYNQIGKKPRLRESRERRKEKSPEFFIEEGGKTFLGGRKVSQKTSEGNTRRREEKSKTAHLHAIVGSTEHLNLQESQPGETL